MVFGSRAFGRRLGPKGGTLVHGISAFIKEAPESSIAPPSMRGHREKVLAVNQEEGSHQTWAMLAP